MADQKKTAKQREVARYLRERDRARLRELRDEIRKALGLAQHLLKEHRLGLGEAEAHELGRNVALNLLVVERLIREHETQERKMRDRKRYQRSADEIAAELTEEDEEVPF